MSGNAPRIIPLEEGWENEIRANVSKTFAKEKELKISLRGKLNQKKRFYLRPVEELVCGACLAVSHRKDSLFHYRRLID